MSEDYLEAGRTIRSYLPDLLDSEQAKSMDAQLADLLNQSDQDVENQILEVLTSTEITRQWTVEFLESETLAEFKAYQPILGNPTQPISGMIKYVCPYGDFVYYQRKEGETIPLCKTHNCALERV
ncbi:MAG: hypothetical protein AB4063_18355 [Crocosphaera sp.]